jgi:hypothetical protein
MLPVGFEPTISAGERPQTYVLDRAATGTGTINSYRNVKIKIKKLVTLIYRVIHKSLRDFRPLRYSNRDGHAEGKHVNRGTDTPISVLPYRCSLFPHLVTWQMSNLTILANSKTQNAFLFPVYAIYRHDCPLAVNLRVRHAT